MERSVFSDAHVAIHVNDETRLVRYTRNREPYESLETVRDVHAKLRDVFKLLPAGDWSLLIDVREAPARNDPAFETEVIGALQAIASRFSKHATLVKSAVGRLQANRLARARESTVGVFNDEAQAIAYLTR